jgi:glyoxylase-like metal-dependent hydrolase (beta-lactamase superfamily II)
MALLQPIAGRAHYLPGSNNLGIVLDGDGGAIAIDTGLDKDTGRLIRKALDEAGLTLRAIVNTHHHADHIGGNDYLARNVAGVRIYAPRHEAALIEQPLLEPIYLNMGAAPSSALRTKWLMAKGTTVDQIVDGERLAIGGLEFEVIALPGHSINQIGLAIDGVCFAADGFFGPAILQKHGIPYAHDVGAQLASLDRLAARAEMFYLPGHGDLIARDALEEALAEPGELTAVARRVQAALGLSLAGIPQYAIFVSAVAAHLSYLEAQGQARVELADAGMVWRL